MSIVLASGSPRRRELMEMLEVKDLVIIPARGEEKPPVGVTPGELVMALASAKAEEARRTPSSVRTLSSGSMGRRLVSPIRSRRPRVCSCFSPAIRMRCTPGCA